MVGGVVSAFGNVVTMNGLFSCCAVIGGVHNELILVAVDDCTVVEKVFVVVETELEEIVLISANEVATAALDLSWAASVTIDADGCRLIIDGSTDFTGCTAGWTKLLIVGGSSLVV